LFLPPPPERASQRKTFAFFRESWGRNSQGPSPPPFFSFRRQIHTWVISHAFPPLSLFIFPFFFLGDGFSFRLCQRPAPVNFSLRFADIDWFAVETPAFSPSLSPSSRRRPAERTVGLEVIAGATFFFLSPLPISREGNKLIALRRKGSIYFNNLRCCCFPLPLPNHRIEGEGGFLCLSEAA